MTALGTSEIGNRLVFKPSPLKVLRGDDSAPRAGADAVTEPLEVLAAANGPGAARSHEDLTIFTRAPLPPPSALPTPDPATAEHQTAATRSPAGWLLLLALALIIVAVIASLRPDLLGLGR